MPEGTLDRRLRVGYGLGSVATGTFGTVPGLMLLPYLTDTLGITAALAGVIVFAPKAWDVVLNPIAGRISDRSTDPRGPRRPFLLRGGLALAVFFALMFASVDLGSTTADGLWVLVMFVLCATAYAFFQVPYVAMPAEITSSYDERTRLMTWRVAVLALAILISGALAPLVVDQTGGGITGHRWSGVFVGALIMVGTLGVYLGTRTAETHAAGETEPDLRAQLRVVAANRPFRALLFCWVIQAVGIGTMLAGVQYFADHVVRAGSGATFLFAAFVGPALLVMPLWTRVGARFGKPRSLIAASLLFATGALALLAAPTLAAAATYLIVALIGCGYAGQQVFAMAMLPDCIAYDTERTGRRQAGVFTGVWTAGETLGLALGPGIYALVLQVFGYVSSSTGEAAPQDDTARLGVLLGFTLVPAALVGGAVLLLRAYRDISR